ncbi:MAG TPA: hypothetical protein VFA59_11185 [Vicinamibacterales bacterium]|nr:hypothetical protein [Vicinamibacterales bacterium]
MFRVSLLVGVLCLASATSVAAQPPPPTSTSFSRVIRFVGALPRSTGASSPTETITFAIYAEETGGTPLWQETQTVSVDGTGEYSALLGSTIPEGLPLELFSTKEARWLAVHVERPGEADRPRVLIASVPYALRAVDADTLGGRPASAYLLAPTGAGATTSTATAGSTRRTGGASSPFTTSTAGTPGYLGLFVDSANLGNSVVAQSGPRIGIGTASPADYLHIAFNDPFGAFTGLAVQNLSSNLNAASGMLFYDQNGLLGQFQGFNNTSHVYAINNIAKNGSSQYDGSFNFLIGNSSKLFVAANGNVGIGTTTPDAVLRVAGNSSATAVYATSPGGGRHGIRADAPAGTAALVALNNPAFIDIFANAAAVTYGGGSASGIIAQSDSGDGVVAGSSSGLAGHFFGNVTVTGTLSKGAGSFKIDHPLDPGNKYLLHSFVESPDMKNVYDGNVTLDARGEAIVTLPDWFEALNRDFRYQLTPLGAPGPNLYVAEEVAHGRFKIAGGIAGGRVSWQITGIRHDAYAEAHRIAIEEDKPATERGHYLYPELYGQPADTRLGPAMTVKKREQ